MKESMKKQPKHKPAADLLQTVESGAATAEIGEQVISLLDAFPACVMLVDADHNIVLANKSVRRELGIAPEDIIGKYCPEVVHGQRDPFPGCPLEEVVSTEQPVKKQIFDSVRGRWIESAVYPTKYRIHDGRAVYLHTIRDITGEKEAKEDLERKYDTERVLNSLLILSLKDIMIEELLGHALDLILSIRWLSLEARGCIFLVDDDNSEVLVMKALKNIESSIQKTCAHLPFGKCLCGRAALTQKIQFATRIDERHDITYPGIIPHGHYCVPILYAGKTLGVITLYIKEGHDRKPEEEEFLTAIVNTLAGIIVREHTTRELDRSLVKLQRTLEGIINALAVTVEMRDPYTAGHQRKVAYLATAIAKEMGLSKEMVQAINITASVHDIGKISVPTEFLSKSGPLSEFEYGLVKKHAQVGYDILKNIEFPWNIAQIVLQHHERMDGSGYPLGLSGENILIEARILALSDVVEAMLSHRPYRSAIEKNEVMAEIEGNSGILFDSNVVAACLKLFREKGFTFE